MSKSQRKYWRALLFREQSGMCALCGASMAFDCSDEPNVFPWHLATIDHIEPPAVGGLHTRSNFRLTHRGCNTVRDHLNVVGVPLVLNRSAS